MSKEKGLLSFSHTTFSSSLVLFNLFTHPQQLTPTMPTAFVLAAWDNAIHTTWALGLQKHIRGLKQQARLKEQQSFDESGGLGPGGVFILRVILLSFRVGITLRSSGTIILQVFEDKKVVISLFCECWEWNPLDLIPGPVPRGVPLYSWHLILFHAAFFDCLWQKHLHQWIISVRCQKYTNT